MTDRVEFSYCCTVRQPHQSSAQLAIQLICLTEPAARRQFRPSTLSDMPISRFHLYANRSVINEPTPLSQTISTGETERDIRVTDWTIATHAAKLQSYITPERGGLIVQ